MNKDKDGDIVKKKKKNRNGESRTDQSLREWKSGLTEETQKFLCDLHSM